MRGDREFLVFRIDRNQAGFNKAIRVRVSRVQSQAGLAAFGGRGGTNGDGADDGDAAWR